MPANREDGEARRISSRVMRIATSPPPKVDSHFQTARRVLEAVSEVTGVPVEVMVGPSRCKRPTRARHVAMHLVRRMTDLRLVDVAGLFHRTDHSTVIYGCERALREENVDLIDLCYAKATGAEVPVGRSWTLDIVDPGTDLQPRVRVSYVRPDGTTWEVNLPMVPR